MIFNTGLSNNNLVMYNEETDCLDVYLNGVLVGSNYMGFKAVELIPIMSSNTTPSGEASASSCLTSDFAAWKAFNGTNAGSSDCWLAPDTDTQPWIAYNFSKKVKVSKLYIENRNYQENTAIKDFVLQGSNDGVTWIDVKSFTNVNTDQKGGRYFEVGDNTNYYSRYRLLIKSKYGVYASIGKLQMYGT